MGGIKGLAASTLGHFRTIAPADPNQKIMEQWNNFCYQNRTVAETMEASFFVNAILARISSDFVGSTDAAVFGLEP